jgi:glucokinase
MKYAIAIEFGGQSIKAALVDVRGNLSAHNRISLNQESPPALDRFKWGLDALIRATTENVNLSAAGIAYPNPCDPGTLTFTLAHKPAYKHINGHALKPVILDSTGLSEYHTIYDAGAAGLGELWQGKIKQHGRYLLLTLGTGLGAVFIEDGLIVTGQHVQGLPDSGELWDYRYRDTELENVTGTTKAAVSIYRQMGGTDPQILGGDLKKLATMGRNNRNGGIGQKAFAEFGRRLGDGLAPIVGVFGPDKIILSGNIALAYDLFGTAVNQALEARLNRSDIATEVVASELIDRGGLLGAAYRAFYPNRPFRLD